MDTHMDFLEYFQSDLSWYILMCLDDPSDIIRASSVSHSWRHFVIANGFCKQLCVRMFPQLASVARVIELTSRIKKSRDVGSSNLTEWEALEKDHKVYGSLFRALTSFAVNDCLVDAISASSTDNYPEESIINTLDPADIVLDRPSYWSSKGQSDPNVPEKLIYTLASDICIITEINIQPFRAYFQPGNPIYSAKSMRFRIGFSKSRLRIGHPESESDIECDLLDSPFEQCANDKLKWTYTSQEFPMAQDNNLQNFKLPEPVLCVGGYLQIELGGRVQTQEMDGLYYICISHVQVLGRSLSPAFEVDIVDPRGSFLLKYYANAFNRMLRSLSDGSMSSLTPPEERLWGRLENLVGFLLHGRNRTDLEQDDEP